MIYQVAYFCAQAFFLCVKYQLRIGGNICSMEKLLERMKSKFLRMLKRERITYNVGL